MTHKHTPTRKPPAKPMVRRGKPWRVEYRGKCGYGRDRMTTGYMEHTETWKDSQGRQ